MFNPAEASNRIKEEFIDYISTSFSIADDEYDTLFRQRLNEAGTISKGPLIDIKDIFKGGRSIEQLCAEHILSPLFSDLEKDKPNEERYKKKLPLHRPLYLHQEKAINVIATQKDNAVITTGTGSGKTECFLIPIINALLKEIEVGTLNDGVRALLIYPMNALANDQMKRLRELLMFYPKITFGVYNGDTEKTEDKALAKYIDLHAMEACEELKRPLCNEYLSRDKMNETPPHILCTNYAMLEHMMLRPENDKIFAGSDFKFVVLDEAHIYTGATGMETALLLRRLKARIKSTDKTQFILTSATLGEEGKSEAEIINFAQNLCGEPFSASDIVYGRRDEVVFNDPINTAPITIFEELAENEETDFPSIFAKYQISYDAEKPIASNLYSLCANCVFYRRLRSEFCFPIDIDQLANSLGITQKQTIAFIHICTLAESNGKALIDAKYHFFIRALEGVYTPLYGEKQIFLERKNKTHIGEKEVACFERAVCQKCGELGLVGKIDKSSKIHKLILATQYEEGVKYFHIKSQDEEKFEELDFEGNEEIKEPDIADRGKKLKSYKEYYLCPICGAISAVDEGHPRCVCGETPIVISEYENSDERCTRCQSGKYRRFYIGSEAATGVLATALFEELPAKIIKDYGEDGIEFEFEGGKQFLAFSDSRSEAAFFASYLDKSYKEFLRRRGLVRVLEKLHDDLLEAPMPLDELADELSKLFTKKESFKNELTERLSSRELRRLSLKNAWMAILTELVYARRRTSLVSLGKIKFEYMGNSDKIVDSMCRKYGLKKEVCKELLDYLALAFASFGALKIDEDVLDAEDRKYIFYTDQPKTVLLQKTASADRYSMSWKARNREGKADSFYPNGRVRLVAKVLNSDEKRANEFLEDYFSQWLTSPANKHRLERGKGTYYFMPAENYQVRIFGDQDAHWYRCEKCNKISVYNINGQCLENGCNGTLTEVDPTKLFADNHYLKLYNKHDLTALLIKEHTAQLSREEGLTYQTQFEKNHIHALSCSTTFEMGVDVGELETVFLRNVPPTAANYAQRAGRAGRSKNAAAYSLTYAKLSSHDFTYFKEPEKIIVGKIKPPKFKTDNRKIVLRHIYAVVLSYFFKLYPNYFNHNKTEAFLDNGGYEDLVSLIKMESAERDGLYALLEKSIPSASTYNWEEEFVGSEGILTRVVEEYKENVKELSESIDQAYQDRDADKARRTERMLDKYRAKELIDFFVRNNILPKYGFPIDTVELDVATDAYSRQELQLSRDLKMAISEYAPGEKVIANNKMYTSRYIKKSFFNGKMDFHTSYISRCDCGTWNYSFQDPRETGVPIKCIACHKVIPATRWINAIEPRAGFVAESRLEEVPMTRPDKIYHSQDSYIGNGKKIDEYRFCVNDREILLKSSEDDSIMVTSNTEFYVCKRCGFAYGYHDVIKDETGKIDKATMDAARKGAPYITVKRKHRDYRDRFCANNVFHPFVLNHIYKTDVVLFDFAEFNGDEKTMWSVVYAILNAMSEVLGIDRDDIGGCLKGSYLRGASEMHYSLVLFDTVAGGAGHVRRLLNADVLTQVFSVAYLAMSTCKCDTSCYNCLRSYSNQRRHQDLDRHLAEQFLLPYVGEVKSLEIPQQTAEFKLQLLADGLPLEDESYEFIFSQLECDLPIVKQLERVFLEKDLPKPDFNDIGFKVENENGYANLFWKKKKVMLFTPDNRDGYELASKCGFICFILDENFHIDLFEQILL